MKSRILAPATIAPIAAIAVLLVVSPVWSSSLSYLETHWDGFDGVDGLFAIQGVTVSPDGAHIYTAGFSDDAVSAFARDASTGSLSFLEVHFDNTSGVDGLDGATSVVVSPDGAHVYVAGNEDSAIAVFSRDSVSGALTFVEAQFDDIAGVDGLARVGALAISPGGENLYAPSASDNGVAVFSRDAGTGALTFVEAQLDSNAGVEGLIGARTAAVSSDGSHVYIASELDSAIVVFARNSSTGALTFVEAEYDGIGGVTGMVSPQHARLSPDGNHLYVVSGADDAVVVFGRDSSTGALIYLETLFDDTGGVQGLKFPSAVSVSPDGTDVFVCARLDDDIVRFSRDSGTGLLAFAEVITNADAGNTMPGPFELAFSPQGNNLYVAGRNFSTLVVFVSTLFADGFESGNTEAWSTTSP